MDAHMTSSSGSGITDGSGNTSSSTPASMEHDAWPPIPDTATSAVNSVQTSRNGALDTEAIGSVPVSRAYGTSAHDHTMAKRNRPEQLNQRFAELSAVIPGLNKMDKSTILCEALAHIRKLQEKIKTLEASCSNGGSLESGAFTEEADDNGFPSSAARRNTMPEIEARLSGSNVMVRIHCEESKGVVVKVLLEMEEGLHLTLTHTSVIPFTAGTVTITMTAKMEEGFTVSADDILARLHPALQEHSNIISI